MQVYSINSFSCCQPRKLMNDQPAPVPNPTPTPSPAPAPNPAPTPQKPEEGKASIYFTGDENNDHNQVKGLRKGMYLLALTPAALSALIGLSGCEKDEFYLKTELWDSDTVNVNVKTYGYGGCGKDTIRDTIYIDRTQHDTCYVDTGSYHVSHDTIVKWLDHFVRPIPLDSLMKNLHNWGVDGTNGANIFDGLTNRNIIHYTAQENWEYNNYEIGNIDLLESNKNRLVYRTERFDYKNRPLSGAQYGFNVVRTPSSPVTVKTANGKTITTTGFFIDVYNTESKDADILDGTKEISVFCQTEGNKVKLYTQDKNGKWVEDGAAMQGYLQEGTSILLKDMIGDGPTEHHLVNVHVSACNDEVLEALYLRQMDDAYAKEQGLH